MIVKKVAKWTTFSSGKTDKNGSSDTKMREMMKKESVGRW